MSLTLTEPDRRAIASARHTPPGSAAHLWKWIKAYTGVHVGRARVCRDHAPPLEWLASLVLDRPALALILGSRGSGKSFLSAIATHLDSRNNPRMGTRILGGSKAQAAQIYDALTLAIADGCGPGGSDKDTLREILKTEAKYRNGSNVSILAASRTSVRGPHVASLRLDEVDEIPAELRDAAVGMAMELRGVPAAVHMTSTWHKVGGPMTELVERGQNGDFPLWTTCAFDTLQRCPDERSGPFVGGPDLFRDCPACPLVKWCHSERDRNGGIPLAKLADGHYGIDTLIQKVQSVSARTFEADYLCGGPRPDGIWFPAFGNANISESAAYDPALPVHLSIDSGVFTGAVAFQIRKPAGGLPLVTVFMEYLSEGLAAEANAKAILAALDGRNGTKRIDSTDPAGGARNPVGPTVLAEFARAGLTKLQRWPVGSVADGLAGLEVLVAAADGSVNLKIDPICKRLILAMKSYARAKRGGQWQDYPEDPQHPHEDLVDALRGGLKTEFPRGIRPAAVLQTRHPARFLY